MSDNYSIGRISDGSTQPTVEANDAFSRVDEILSKLFGSGVTLPTTGPAEGQVLSRQGNALVWVDMSGGGGGGGGIEEAPQDGKLYGRKNADWEEVTEGGGNPPASSRVMQVAVGGADVPPTFSSVPTPGSLLVALCSMYNQLPATSGWTKGPLRAGAQDYMLIVTKTVQSGDAALQDPLVWNASEGSAIVFELPAGTTLGADVGSEPNSAQTVSFNAPFLLMTKTSSAQSPAVSVVSGEPPELTPSAQVANSPYVRRVQGVFGDLAVNLNIAFTNTGYEGLIYVPVTYPAP